MKMLKAAIGLTCIIAGTLAARAQERLYAVVNYMHIPEGQSHEEYIALEKLWQRLHQKAVDTGFCKGWYLSRVENGGRNQYVTVELYNSLNKYADRWPDSMRAGLYNSEENAKMQQTGQLRVLTRSELWEIQASAIKSGDQEAPSIIQVDFIKPKPKKYRDYYGMERNLYQKIHKARIDAGQMKSWYFLSRMLPGGADNEFDFVTLNGFPEKGGAWDNKVAQSALTKEEWDSKPPSSDVRNVVRQEIWHPMLRTTPAKSIAAVK